MNELKPEDVMRALECCASPTQICKECPMPQEVKDDCRCMETISRNTLALLREKDAEIERLNGALKAEERHNELTMECAKKALANARSEAITEFSKELTSELIKGGIYPVFVKGAIDRTAKKLKGETDGKSDL
jgi:hypothetical protein